MSPAVLGIIGSALEQAGGRLANVVRTRLFVVDIKRDWEAVGRHRRGMRPATAHLPALDGRAERWIETAP